MENVVLVVYLTIYLVTRRNPRNDAPINIVCQFHCLYDNHVSQILLSLFGITRRTFEIVRLTYNTIQLTP